MVLTRDLMMTGYSVGVAATVVEAARRLYASATDAIAVRGDHNDLLGMLHCRDILASVARDDDPRQTTIDSLLPGSGSSAPISVEATREQAMLSMTTLKVDQLLVFDDDDWVGTLTQADVVQSMRA